MTPCVNTWCKYHNDGFYCQENCGSYVPSNTKLKDLNLEKIRAKDFALFVDDSQESTGTFDSIINGHEEDKIKAASYDFFGHTFCITI